MSRIWVECDSNFDGVDFFIFLLEDKLCIIGHLFIVYDISIDFFTAMPNNDESKGCHKTCCLYTYCLWANISFI